MSLLTQVSSAIRILRWNRDVSARASHLVVEKDPLITYESVISDQAGSENVSGSTVSFERKLMSTKTSIKRIAAVAAVALTLGGFSAVSAHAGTYGGSADALTVAAATGTGVTGTAAKVGFTSSFIAGTTGDNTKVSAVLISAPATSVALPTVETTTVVTGGTESVPSDSVGKLTVGTISAATYVSGTFNVSLNAAVAGTYVVKLIQAVAASDGTAGTSAVTTGPTVTFTITAAATADAANTTSVIKAGSGNWAAGTDGTADDDVLAPKGTSSTKVAIIKVTPKSATADLTSSTTLSATIAGPGTLSSGASNATSGGSASVGRAITAAAAGDQYFAVYSDGTSGTATITISAGTTVLATETVVFYGSAASYTATVTNSVVTTAAAAAAVTTAGSQAPATPARHAVKVLVKDAAGNPVADARVYANSDDKTVINADYLGDAESGSDSDGYAYFNLVGLKAGTANISFTSASSATDLATKTAAGTAILTAPAVAIRVGSYTASSASITFDSDSYNPGAAATVSVTVLDSKGLPVADGVYSVFTAATTSTLAVLQGTMPGTAKDGVTTAGAFVSPQLAAGQVWVTGSAGKASFTVNMPLAAGAVTFSGTGASGLATAQAGVAITGSATVSGGAAAEAAQAAIDAAQEATDAANAAYDAANNAMDSADAATAAAQDASDNASAALAAVTSLSATVAKLVASVSAIAASLASIKKKLGVK